MRDRNFPKSDFEEDILPEGCNTEYSYQVCIYFGEEHWTLKIYEFKVRLW